MSTEPSVRTPRVSSFHRCFLSTLGLLLLLFSSAFASAAAQRVGVLVLVEDELSHTRIGVTAFGNAVERVPGRSLDAPAQVREQVDTYLDALGYTVVPLEWPGDAETPGDGLVRHSWSSHKVRRPFRAVLLRLAEANALDLLVVFETFEGEDRFGGSSASVGGYGLYSRAGAAADANLAYAQIRGYRLSLPELDYVGGGEGGRPTPLNATQIDANSIERLEQALQPVIESAVRNALLNFRLPRIGPAP